MKNLSRLQILIKAPAQLGLKAVYHYASYQMGLRSGFFQACTPAPDADKIQTQIPKNPRSLLQLPSPNELRDVLGGALPTLLQTADSLVDGKFHLFGGDLKPLDLSPHAPALHWSQYERGKLTVDGDIKFIWEPARFGWAFTLARAYHLTADSHYSTAFENYLNQFTQENPAYLGPNWTSGQEAGLRILALCFVYQIFSASTTISPTLLQAIRVAVAVNAMRIPPTLAYARAQRNNHLISEAVGLYTAGLFLDGYPQARKWRQIGWKVFNQAINDQISADGTYIQHSNNYHRLMLDEAIWMAAIAKNAEINLPESALKKLALATRHLYEMVDLSSGRVPNLGHQDGSNILPLAVAEHLDYRPVLQAAGRLFLGEEIFPAGQWDEKALWLHIPQQPVKSVPPSSAVRLNSSNGWASLRAVRFHARPAHADQLHVEIWHQGQNLALDAGTYLYNAQPPWRNALQTTRVHNTITIDGLDQMLPAGRFLWLDRAQASIISTTPTSITASQDGYQKLGINHERTLIRTADTAWEIADRLTARSNSQKHIFTVHWLLPALPFQVHDTCIDLQNGDSDFHLSFTNDTGLPGELDLLRGGKHIHGHSNLDPLVYGWFSPSYGTKNEALTILYTIRCETPLTITTRWNLSK